MNKLELVLHTLEFLTTHGDSNEVKEIGGLVSEYMRMYNLLSEMESQPRTFGLNEWGRERVERCMNPSVIQDMWGL